jgi:hypothetical protein
MSVELTEREHQIIQQLILDRWNPHRINKKIANHHRLTINQVKTGARRPSWARIGPRGPEEDHIQ